MNQSIPGLLTLQVARIIIRVKFKEVFLMQKKLTVTIDEEVYEGLRTVIGPRKISRFIEELVRPHVVKKDMYAAYREMAADQIRESEAFEWAEGTIGDLSDEER
jgi:predicted CopG family antitoxin